MNFFSQHPILTRFSLVLFLPVILLIGIACLKLRSSLPEVEHSLEMQDMGAAVVTTFDKHGIPYIEAKSYEDALQALGYIHARDRFWQMELGRRTAQGRLSEILGKDSLQTDITMRTLGLYKVAQKNIEYMDENTKLAYSHYVRGVNAWLDENRFPVEFSFLSYKPETWSIADSISLMKLMALNLDENYKKELMNELLVSALGQEKAGLIRGFDFHLEQNVAADNDTGQLKEVELAGNISQHLAIADFIHQGGIGLGSNSWVVSARNSATGRPILANDPHLNLQLPSYWYLTHIETSELSLAGATVPGFPFLLIGHNRNIAWSITAMKADVQDLVIEETHPLNANLYKQADGWHTFEERIEEIHIRDDFPAWLNASYKPVKWKVRSTNNGPLIGDTFMFTRPVSLRWSALDDNDQSAATFMKVNSAKNWDTFLSAVSEHAVPAINFLYADTAGNIGYTPATKIPLREKGNGSLPLQGGEVGSSWKAYVPFEDMPKILNPDKGFIVAANNEITDLEWPFFVSNDFAPSYRADRISQLLQDDISRLKKIDLKRNTEIQLDEYNSQAASMPASLFNASMAENDKQQEFFDALKKWDFLSTKSSALAALYHSWLKHFSRKIMMNNLITDSDHPQIKNALEQISHYVFPEFLASLSGPEAIVWCDDKQTRDIEDCVKLSSEALQEAVKELTLLGNNNALDTKWGAINYSYYGHSLFAKVPPLDIIFDRKIASGGDAYTVNVGSTYLFENKEYRKRVGAGYRQVIDVGAWDASLYMIDIGQSGHFLSKNYDDLITKHENGEYLNLKTPSPGKDTAMRLQLLPRKEL